MRVVSYRIVIVPNFLPEFPSLSPAFNNLKICIHFSYMESGLPFHKCKFCFPRAWWCSLSNPGGASGWGYLHGEMDLHRSQQVCLTKYRVPRHQPSPVSSEIQRSWEFKGHANREGNGSNGAQTVLMTMSFHICQWVFLLFFLFSSLPLLIFFLPLILSVYFCCRFIRCTVKCHLALQNCHRQQFMNGIIHWQTI